jgi:integrase
MREQRNARRIRVERGIYYRETPTGRRYEITYSDSTGHQRWKVIDGGLKEARTARADVLSRLARGERVAPSKVTLADFAAPWLKGQLHLRETTGDRYEELLRVHVLPLLGQRRLGAITEEDIAALIAAMTAEGRATGTITKTLGVLSRILRRAVRKGLIAANPVTRLERDELPAPDQRREMRILDRGEIGKLVDAAPEQYKTLIAVSIFTGLRQGEALGLLWGDVDLDGARIHVRKQLNRSGNRVEPKTPQAIREIELAAFLVKILRDHKERAFAAGHAKPEDFVFASQVGGPMHYRNVVQRGLVYAVKAAGLDAPSKPTLRWHDLRHTAASLLIAEGLPVTYVARQLGHASPKITLDTYAHLFDREAHAERARDALDNSFGAMF